MIVVAALTKSTEEFARVKAGMESGGSFPWEFIGWFLFGLTVIILIVLAFNHTRAKRYSGILKGWAAISEPNRIAAVFKRAASRQADCTMEIFDQQHTSIYRCHVVEARPASRVFLDLASLPSPDADFEGFPAQVHMNFRPAPKEEMEHYQFSTQTMDIGYHREKNWRVARVSVSWPKSIISAQRRDFLRMEPVAEHSMSVRLAGYDDDLTALFEENKVEEFETAKQVEGAVLDISVGGMQLLFPGVAQIKEQKKYLAILDLPMTGLDFELKNSRLYLIFQPLSRDVLGLTSEAPDYRPGLGSRTVVRGSFVGRYRLQPDIGQWAYLPFSVESFQDLAHWIHAYQRYLLKKENGLMSAPVERPNNFQAVPLTRYRPDSDEGKQNSD